MKYAIVAAVVIAVYGMNQCFPFLAFGEEVGLLRSLYCRVSFFHFIPRKFSPIDFVVHLFVWIVICILVWRVFVRYLKGKIY